MRYLFFLLALFFISPASAQNVQMWCYTSTSAPNYQPCAIGEYPFKALGYQQLTGMSSATNLTVPAGSRVAEICVEAQAIRYRDDGTAPTGSVGMPIAAGTCFQYSGPLSAIQFIQQTSGAIVNASYYN